MDAKVEMSRRRKKSKSTGATDTYLSSECKKQGKPGCNPVDNFFSDLNVFLRRKEPYLICAGSTESKKNPSAHNITI